MLHLDFSTVYFLCFFLILHISCSIFGTQYISCFILILHISCFILVLNMFHVSFWYSIFFYVSFWYSIFHVPLWYSIFYVPLWYSIYFMFHVPSRASSSPLLLTTSFLVHITVGLLKNWNHHILFRLLATKNDNEGELFSSACRTPGSTI